MARLPETAFYDLGTMSDSQPPRAPSTPRAEAAVRRALAARESAYAEEVQRLLDAGLELMRETGGAPRVTDIVRRAGLSNAAFYRHFPSKDDLVAAVVEAGTYRLVDYATHQMAKARTPEARLAAWVTCIISQASNPSVAHDTRSAMAVLRQLARTPPGGAHPRALEELVVEPLKELGSSDPARDAATINHAVFGRLQDFLWEEPPAKADLDHLIEFCLAAIRR